MENTNLKKGELKQTIFLVLIVIFILILIFTLITLIKNKELISVNPLVYGMKVNDFSYCNCWDNSGNYWESTASGFKITTWEVLK